MLRLFIVKRQQVLKMVTVKSVEPGLRNALIFFRRHNIPLYLKVLKNAFISTVAILFLSACGPQKQEADLIVHNGRIYTVDSVFTVCEAMAIKNGSIIATGDNAWVLEHFSARQTEDVKGQAIFPGFIDAHCHFVGYALGLQQVNLVGSRSFTEVLERVARFTEKNKQPPDAAAHGFAGGDTWILGRGWDQNDWTDKNYPDKQRLDSLFPHSPVMLVRIDGHAALVNSAALKRSGITAATHISGGEVLMNNGEPNGVLIDNAVDLVKKNLPETTREHIAQALLQAQSNCLAQGLTTLDEAGLMKNDIDLIDALQHEGKLKLRVYAMLSDSTDNYSHYLKSGPYKTERLNVRSFKFYADGALGSRGACLHEDYSDRKNWRGFLLSEAKHFEACAKLMAEKGFQMNTHCIGDSAMTVILNTYQNYCNKTNDRRWRIEHAQVLQPRDFRKFRDGIIPSVQPTHATSDMYWVSERLGDRSPNAYAYKELLTQAGVIALGTDFPVEDISPFKTFFAAVARQDSKGFPAGGFQTENALSREETLRGMTIQAAYANFEEKEKGSLEKGKLADFVILNTDLMTCPLKEILNTKVVATYINGDKVY